MYSTVTISIHYLFFPVLISFAQVCLHPHFEITLKLLSILNCLSTGLFKSCLNSLSVEVKLITKKFIKSCYCQTIDVPSDL